MLSRAAWALALWLAGCTFDGAGGAEPPPQGTICSAGTQGLEGLACGGFFNPSYDCYFPHVVCSCDDTTYHCHDLTDLALPDAPDLASAD